MQIKKNRQLLFAAVAVVVVLGVAVGLGQGDLMQGKLLQMRGAAQVRVPDRETCTYINALFDRGIFSAAFPGSGIKATLCEQNYPDIWYEGGKGGNGKGGRVEEQVVVSDVRCRLLQDYARNGVLTPKLRGDMREWYACERIRDERQCRFYVARWSQGHVSGIGTENQVAYCFVKYPVLNTLSNAQKCAMYDGLAAQGIISSGYPKYLAAWSTCINQRRERERAFCEQAKWYYDAGILTQKLPNDLARIDQLCRVQYPDIWWH